MLLIDALTLCPGDRIDAAGDARETKEWTWRGSGTVVGVTDGGGILIDVDPRYGSGRRMVGYHMVRQWHRAAPRGSRPRRLGSAAEARARIKGSYTLPPGGREARELLRDVSARCGLEIARSILSRVGLAHVREMRQGHVAPITVACRRALAG